MAITTNNLTEKWNTKLQSYLTLIENLQNEVAQAQEMPDDPKKALKLLLYKLKEFATKRFNLLADGFSNNLLEEEDLEPKEYVLQKILDQMGHDLTVLEQIADDWAHDNSIKRPTLEDGTKYAQSALTFAQNKGFLKTEVIPLIYLHKTPVIRVIPYAPAALIGIPYTAVNAQKRSNPLDLLAIPHEVGHYVYWNGKYGSESIKDYLEGKLLEKGLSQYAHWLEEIFADVFSALFGKKNTADSIQEILKDNRPIFFNLDDGSHPPNVIRPYIYAFALGDDEELQKEIIESWDDFLKKRDIKRYFKRAVIILDSNKRIQSLTYEKIRFGENAIPDGLEIIQALVAEIAEIFKVKNQETTEVNIPELAANNEVEAEQKPSKTSENHESMADADFEKLKNSIKEKKEKRATEKIPSSKWRPVYRASGWTSGGEEDGYHTIE